MLHNVSIAYNICCLGEQTGRKENNFASMMQILFSTGCSRKECHRLIWCKLKRTVFIRSTFLFSESSHFNLKFGIKQPKICGKPAEGWLTKPKISGRHNFLEKCTNLKPAILLYQRSLKCRNFSELDKGTIALLSYQVNNVFCCTKGLHKMKN